jgi:hypothetical protein
MLLSVKEEARQAHRCPRSEVPPPHVPCHLIAAMVRCGVNPESPILAAAGDCRASETSARARYHRGGEGQAGFQGT